MVNFGNTLKELRQKAGMTQKDLASKIGVTKSVISYYELSERSPSPEMLMKLAAIFHVSTDFLLGIQKQDTIDLSGLSAEDRMLVRTMVDTLRKKEEYKKQASS